MTYAELVRQIRDETRRGFYRQALHSLDDPQLMLVVPRGLDFASTVAECVNDHVEGDALREKFDRGLVRFLGPRDNTHPHVQPIDSIDPLDEVRYIARDNTVIIQEI